jgi:hypothetical protein
MGHGELFLRGHAAAGGLLAVAEGGVEERNVIGLICAHEFACQGRFLPTFPVSRIETV